MIFLIDLVEGVDGGEEYGIGSGVLGESIGGIAGRKLGNDGGLIGFSESLVGAGEVVDVDGSPEDHEMIGDSVVTEEAVDAGEEGEVGV
jgi:hypothetical protein